ncbi:hypothetical protein D3C72_1802780 [compost metagenome]
MPFCNSPYEAPLPRRKAREPCFGIHQPLFSRSVPVDQNFPKRVIFDERRLRIAKPQIDVVANVAFQGERKLIRSLADEQISAPPQCRFILGVFVRWRLSADTARAVAHEPREAGLIE